LRSDADDAGLIRPRAASNVRIDAPLRVERSGKACAVFVLNGPHFNRAPDRSAGTVSLRIWLVPLIDGDIWIDMSLD
jgi:hypothetical protein